MFACGVSTGEVLLWDVRVGAPIHELEVRHAKPGRVFTVLSREISAIVVDSVVFGVAIVASPRVVVMFFFL